MEGGEQEERPSESIHVRSHRQWLQIAGDLTELSLAGSSTARNRVPTSRLTFLAGVTTRDERCSRLQTESRTCPQGNYLYHLLQIYILILNIGIIIIYNIIYFNLQKVWNKFFFFIQVINCYISTERSWELF